MADQAAKTDAGKVPRRPWSRSAPSFWPSFAAARGGREFLHKRTRHADATVAHTVAAKLDRLPLVLEQASAYLEQTGGTEFYT